jgi:hypothetical protein
MKDTTISRKSRAAPRNPLVAAARFRQAGAHGVGAKRARLAARRELMSALREMKQSP